MMDDVASEDELLEPLFTWLIAALAISGVVFQLLEHMQHISEYIHIV